MMMLANFDNLDPRRDGAMRRAARLAMLRHQVIHHIERTDASAQKVEQVLAVFAEANAPAPHRPRPPTRPASNM